MLRKAGHRTPSMDMRELDYKERLMILDEDGPSPGDQGRSAGD